MFTLLLSLIVQTPQAPPVAAASVVVTPAPPVAEINMRQLKGPLVRQLAWSPDQSELYLQTYEANRDASVKTTYHYVITVSDGTRRQVDVPPTWAVAYYQWKSGQASPDDAAWKIDVSTEKKIQSATAMPMGGDLARGGTVDPTGGISIDTVTASAAQAGNVSVYTMRLSGEIVGEWMNHPIVPGLTFGWAPKGHTLIAFADKSGQLTVMDRAGKSARVDGTQKVTLPAWSQDGTHLAYLEQKDRNTYSLIVASVSQR
ncbi:MAG: hypothetical protein FJW21_00355 [Acidimicrobiia bacterium]|nr:hypothetical protein [Acidimicrobiia bacterium]